MRRAVASFTVLALSLGLAACGGGSSGSSPVIGGGGATPTPTPTSGPTTSGVVAIAPSSLAFAAPGSAAQQFTVSSTVTSVAPTLNATACAPVATISGGGTTLPATFTVTPTANGSCTIVATVGNAAVTLGITVGSAASPGLNQPSTTLTLAYPGGTATYAAAASSGAIAFDATACNGIAQIAPSGTGTTNASFTATAVAPGSCAVTVTDGASSFQVPISVTGSQAATGVYVTPSAVTVSASAGTPSQQITVSGVGSVGSVSIDESACTGAIAKLAYFTFTGVGAGQSAALPQNGTVTPYGGATGTCTIIFTPQSGNAAALTVYVTK